MNRSIFEMKLKLQSFVFAAIYTAAMFGQAYADTAATTLTWNGEEGASWTTGENWLKDDGETTSAWIDGANAVFTDAATVSLDGNVTVSNITAASTLTVKGVMTYSYAKFLTQNSALVFPGLKLSDITAIDGTMAGGYFSAIPSVEAHAYHYDFKGNTGTAQFQCKYDGSLRCVRVEFSEQSDGVYAKVIGKAGYIPKPDFIDRNGRIGGDAEKMPGMLWNINPATSDNSGGYGVRDLRASTARMAISGEAKLGGVLTLTNVSAEVTAPISQTWSQSIKCSNGRIVVRGMSSAMEERTFGITDPKVEKEKAAWLTTTATDTVFTNMVLSRTVPVSGVMRGSYIGYNAPAKIHHVKFNGQTMTFQIQCVDPSAAVPPWIKGALVELKQSGANVTARAIRTYLYNFSEGESRTTGVDLEAAGSAANPGKYNVQQYGVKSLTFQTVSVPSLTLTANNQSCMDLLADNAQISFSGYRAQPLKIIARNNASLIYNEYTTTSNPYNDGGSFMRLLESGSTLQASGSLKVEGRAAFEFVASTNTITLKNYFNDLTLRDGSLVRGSGNLQSGYYNAYPTSTYTSAGTGPNYIEAPMVLVRHNQIGNMTNTLVLATETDLFISGDIRDEGNANFKGACIVKRGAAKLTLSGNNTFAGRFTVEGGTVELGSDSALPKSAPLTLAGGKVKCGTFANATGPLTLSGDTTIDLEGGSLAFAGSGDAEWAPGATLAITGTESLPTRTLRFGTSAQGLTFSQVRQITYNGEKVSLDDSGYLRKRGGFMLIFK